MTQDRATDRPGDSGAATTAPFRSALARGRDWGAAAKTCVGLLGRLGPEHTLGLVYVTPPLMRDLGSVVTFLRSLTGIEHWCGCVAAGIMANGESCGEGEAAVAVMVLPLPPASFRILTGRILTGRIPTDRIPTDLPLGETGRWAAAHGPTFGLAHATPTAENLPGLIGQAAETADGFLVGGLAMDGGPCPHMADTDTGSALSGVLFTSEVAVTTGLSQGCSPIGPPRLVTRAQGNIVATLDQRPALEALKEDVGEVLARDLSRIAGYIHVALMVEGSDMADYSVRNLMGIDPAKGLLAVGAEVSPGDRLLFVRRDAETARRDFHAMVERTVKRAPAPVQGALYISCVARQGPMFDKDGEAGALRRLLGEDVPFVGFYALGEIFRNRLYGYTGVLTLFN